MTELKKKPEALEFFHSLTGVNRYAILYRIQISRTPEKRKEKMDKFVEMLLKKEKIYE